MCMSTCMIEYVHAGCQWRTENGILPLDLVLQAVVIYPICMLGTQSSVRVAKIS